MKKLKAIICRVFGHKWVEEQDDIFIIEGCKRGIERYAIKLLIKFYRKLNDRFNDIDELETMNSTAIAEIQRTLSLMQYEFNFLSQKTKTSLTEFESTHIHYLQSIIKKLTDKPK